MNKKYKKQKSKKNNVMDQFQRLQTFRKTHSFVNLICETEPNLKQKWQRHTQTFIFQIRKKKLKKKINKLL